jgi:hypothetical protein
MYDDLLYLQPFRFVSSLRKRKMNLARTLPRSCSSAATPVGNVQLYILEFYPNEPPRLYPSGPADGSCGIAPSKRSGTAEVTSLHNL